MPRRTPHTDPRRADVSSSGPAPFLFIFLTRGAVHLQGEADRRRVLGGAPPGRACDARHHLPAPAPLLPSSGVASSLAPRGSQWHAGTRAARHAGCVRASPTA